MTPAVDQLVAAQVPHEIVTYEQHGESDYGREAATALGIDPDQLHPTLYNALVDLEQDACPISETLIDTQDDLCVAPSNILLSAIEQQLAGKEYVCGKLSIADFAIAAYTVTKLGSKLDYSS